jgi:hypothetical protein
VIFKKAHHVAGSWAAKGSAIAIIAKCKDQASEKQLLGGRHFAGFAHKRKSIFRERLWSAIMTW